MTLSRALATFPLEDLPDLPARAAAIVPLAEAAVASERDGRQALARAILSVLQELAGGRRELLIVVPYLASGADLLERGEIGALSLQAARYEIEAGTPAPLVAGGDGELQVVPFGKTGAGRKVDR